MARVLRLACAVALVGAFTFARPQDTEAASISQDGWSLTYAATANDGLSLTSATFNGTKVFAKATLPFVDVLYESNTCCHDELGDAVRKSGPSLGTFSGGFQISSTYCFGSCTPYDASNAFSYKYAERYFFYSTGQWLARLDVYGPGIQSTHTYKAYWRVDYDITDAASDEFQSYTSGAWHTQATEGSFCDDGSNNSSGYEWRQSDLSPVRRYSIDPPALSSSVSGCDFALQFDGTELSGNPSTYLSGEAISNNDDVQWYLGVLDYVRPAGCSSGSSGGCTTGFQLGFSGYPTGY
jgi:hypothetical protein